MTQNSPEELRAEIARTRAELSDNVDALTDTADPKNIADLGSVQDRASGALDTVSDAPGQVRRKAQGNPLAAGLIAFGIGYLISSAIPSSEKEQEAASRLQDKAAPLTDKVREAASDVADRLREPAQQAAASIKDTATDAVANVKDQGASAKDDVQSQVQDSGSAIKHSSPNRS